MPVIQGNTSGSIAVVGYKIPCTVKSMTLSNISGGSVSVGVSVMPLLESSNVFWQGSIDDGKTEVIDTVFKLGAETQIVITASGSLDYYITIE
jgi:alpha-D-ribose 1-methylphosphonate 5-phosphate C-P lyase